MVGDQITIRHSGGWHRAAQPSFQRVRFVVGTMAIDLILQEALHSTRICPACRINERWPGPRVTHRSASNAEASNIIAIIHLCPVRRRKVDNRAREPSVSYWLRDERNRATP